MCHVCSRPLLHICTRKCVWLVRTAVLDKHSSTWAAKGGNIAQYALNECSFIQSVSEHKHHAAHNHCVPRVPGRCKSHCQLLQFWLIRGEAIELQIYIPPSYTDYFPAGNDVWGPTKFYNAERISASLGQTLWIDHSWFLSRTWKSLEAVGKFLFCMQSRKWQERQSTNYV